PGHHYSPIPSVAEMKAKHSDIFENVPREVHGVDLNEKHQLELLDQFRKWYDEQPFVATKTAGRRYYFENPNYSYADGLVLYFMMRYFQPRRIIEVGSGHSSCAMLDVNQLFFGSSIEFSFIEPYPALLLSLLEESDKPHVRLFDRNVQEVELGVFRELQPGDILFIDSSHVSKTGSDVNYLLFKVFPELQRGVHIHFHDIFHGFEYPSEWAYEGRAWNEDYVLRAFLSHNREYRIEFFTSYIMEYFKKEFETHFPLMMKNSGGGLWLTKLGDGSSPKI